MTYIAYPQVRDNGETGNVHFFACNTVDPVTVVSANRWLWVKFYSDESINNIGFSANFSVTQNPSKQHFSNVAKLKSTIRRL